MIIPKQKVNLEKTIKKIENSDLAFLIEPDFAELPGVSVEFDHLQMLGPSRQRAYPSKTLGSHQGSAWRSSIALYPVDTKTDGVDIFENMLKGNEWSYDAQKRFGEVFQIIKIVYGPEHQPKRRDETTVIPHVIEFMIHSSVDADYQGNNEGHLVTGKLDYSLKERILFPPPKYFNWLAVGRAKGMVDRSQNRTLH